MYTGSGAKLACVRLCPLSAPVSQVWAAWEKRQAQVRHTVAWLLRFYLDNPQAARHARHAEEQRLARSLCGAKTTAGVLGDALLSSMTPGRVKRYLNLRAEAGSPVAGNREIGLLRRAWNWARELDMVRAPNPCLLVRRNKEAPRTRYVTDEEYSAVCRLAGSGPPYIQPAMELAFLCRMRRGEVLSALRSDVKPGGFDTRRSKGSRDAITAWSDRLRAAINAALATPRSLDGVYLLQDARGQPITAAAFSSAWRRLQALVRAIGIEPFPFHDLKAKGVSDFDGDKQAASGHRTPAMVAVYDRKKPVVKPTR